MPANEHLGSLEYWCVRTTEKVTDPRCFQLKKEYYINILFSSGYINYPCPIFKTIFGSL